MDFDTAHGIEVLTVSTTSTPGTSVKNVVPLQVDLMKYPIFSKDERNKLRRPVRPIDRQRMRPWLMELLDLGNVFGLRWTNRHQGIFQISWRHASRLGWNLETDGDVFERWARHTGIYKEGDPPEPKRWKANFRCALHSLHDVIELTNAVERRGRNACRTYRFLQSNDEQSINRKRAKARRAKELQEEPQKKCLKETVPLIVQSDSSEEIISDTESEASRQDKVIVQKLDMKTDIPGEDFCLQHDHDYAGPDKTQKTIVLRQGVGSIVLHKEVQNPPETADEVQSLLMSNLDQLASAAVNSAGMSHESDSDSIDGQISWNIKSVVNIPQVSIIDDLEVKETNCNVKHLLTDKNMVGKNIPGKDKCTMKDKLFALVNESVNVNMTESDSEISHLCEHKRSSLCLCPCGKIKCEGSKELSNFPCQTSLTRKRTSSPKILCRRSKRNETKSEKSMPKSTEPLMSSCLLLLEAATRLDNAEKTGMPSTSFKASICKQNNKIVSERQLHEFTNIGNLKEKKSLITKAKVNAVMSAQNSEWQHGRQVSGVNQTKSFGILRSTLENTNRITIHGDNMPKSKAVKHLLRESSQTETVKPVHFSDREDNTEAPIAKGLFSGSKIQSKSPVSLHSSKSAKDKGSLGLSNNRLVVCEQIYKEHGSADDGNEVMYSCSNTQLSNSSNVSLIKSSTGVQQLVLQKALPALNASFKRTLTSRFDTVSPVILDHTSSAGGHIPQIFFSPGTSLLEPTPQITSSSQECLVLTAETHDMKNEYKYLPFPLSSTSSLNKVMEQPFHPECCSSEQMHMLDQSKSGKALISIIGSQNVSLRTSSGTKTQTKTSLQSSVDPFSISAAPTLKTVTFTAASCQPACSCSAGILPLNVLPIYSQADISIPAKSKTKVFMHSTAHGQSEIPIKSDYILANTCTDTSLLTVQDEDVFVFQSKKNAGNDIQFHVLPVSNSPCAFTNMQAEIKSTNSANIHQVDTESQSILEPGDVEPVIVDESKNTCLQFSSSYPFPSICQSQMQTISVLPRTCQFTGQYNVATLQDGDPSLPAIINGRDAAVGSVALSTIIRSETLHDISLVNKTDIFCDIMMKVTSGESAPVHTPSAVSSSCTAHSTVTQSGISLNNSLMTAPHYSSASLQNHISIVLDFQDSLQAQMTRNEDTASQRQDSLCSLRTYESVSVKSLAELCKRNLAHIFSALDHQASESDENNSVTESPMLELKDDTSSTSKCEDMIQAVTLQQKISCLKCETGSPDCEDTFQHTRCFTAQTKVSDEDLPISLDSSSFKYHTKNTAMSNVSP